MDIPAWPELPEHDRWLTDAVERRLRNNTQSAKQLRARARDLRAEAMRTDVTGIREATLALAERYEQAATVRPSA
jgi:hypothetical protein